ncbi:MAG TPA: hypothetical protein VL503_10615 [Candidatus Omnitrophota bacterium]|jgi:hypothetical protein|nr:hypothetical protein [Candidatus Omnitrophota bacterium]
MIRARWTVLLTLLLLPACSERDGRVPESTDAPVDTARIHAPEVASWPYRREISADLDGDHKLDRVVIAADVTLGPTGPLWGDAHRWAVYVEPERGERTLLYGALVHHGFAEAAVLDPDEKGHRMVLIQERTPEQVRALEVEYRKGKAKLASAAAYRVGEWLPGSASMR